MFVFETARFRVRPWRLDAADSAACFAIFENEEVSQWLRRPPYAELSEAEAANRLHRQRYAEDPGLGWWAAEGLETREVVAQVGVRPMPDDSTELEVGYHVRRDWWGRGVATELCRGALEYARRHFPQRQLVAVTLPENAASRRVMEKAGFVYTGECVFKGFDSVRYEWR